jgi:hypothetical protein
MLLGRTTRLRAALAIVAIVAGCGGPAATRPDATAQAASSRPAPTADPSTIASSSDRSSATTAPPPGNGSAELRPDSIASVSSGPLRVRSRPSISVDSQKLEPLLSTGTKVFVIDGPVRASEYDWYMVRPMGGAGPLGWVAAADHDQTPWLAPATVACPADPSLDDLGARMEAVVRLFCYGSRTFTFTDSLSWGPGCGDGNVLESPAWMAGCSTTFYWGAGVQSGAPLAITPDLLAAAGPRAEDDSFRATVVAHLDDPAARTCQPYPGLNVDYELLRVGVVLGCRATFVATSLVRLGP